MSTSGDDIEIVGDDLNRRIVAHAQFMYSLVGALATYRSACMRLQGYKGLAKNFRTDGRFGFENRVVEYIKAAKEYLAREPGEPIEATAGKIFYLDSLQKTFLEDISVRSAPHFWAGAHKKALFNDIQEVVQEETLKHKDLNLSMQKWYKPWK